MVQCHKDVYKNSRLRLEYAYLLFNKFIMNRINSKWADFLCRFGDKDYLWWQLLVTHFLSYKAISKFGPFYQFWVYAVHQFITQICGKILVLVVKTPELVESYRRTFYPKIWTVIFYYNLCYLPEVFYAYVAIELI